MDPGEIENCGTVYDDNCNGNLNEEWSLDCIPLFEDYDGDGHGVSAFQCLCEGVLLLGDCVCRGDSECVDWTLRDFTNVNWIPRPTKPTVAWNTTMSCSLTLPLQ